MILTCGLKRANRGKVTSSKFWAVCFRLTGYLINNVSASNFSNRYGRGLCNHQHVAPLFMRDRSGCSRGEMALWGRRVGLMHWDLFPNCPARSERPLSQAGHRWIRSTITTNGGECQVRGCASAALCGYGGSLSCETHPPFRRFVGSEGDEGFEEQHRQLSLQMLYLRTEDPPEVHEVPSWKHVIFDGLVTGAGWGGVGRKFWGRCWVLKLY